MKSAFLFIVAFAGLAGIAQAEPLVFEGTEGAGKGKHIVFLAGDHEYRSEESLPALARLLAKHHGFQCTVLFNIDPATGEIVAGTPSNMPSMEVLDSADLAVVFLRFQNLPNEQMKHFDDYLKRGGPVVGLRTATHGFRIPSDQKFAKYSFDGKVAGYELGFGHQVLGQTWVGHYGRNHRQSTRISIVDAMSGHPILRGVKDVWVHAGAYVGKPTDGDILTMAQPLDGMTPDSPASVSQPPMPSEWTRTYRSESGKEGRVFTSLYGTPEDLTNDGYRRMIVNGIFWAIGLEAAITPDMNVAFVGPFEPNTFGNQTHARGIKPEAYAGFESPIPAHNNIKQPAKKRPAGKKPPAKKPPAKKPTAEQSSSKQPQQSSARRDAVIEPTWESLAANYQPPQWFQDGKLGVWMHWGIPSAADENRPNDGSHYARRMYAVVPDDYTGKMGMSEILTKWHTQRYGHPSEFGYEDLIPLFTAEKWDPDALVKFVKENGARFIMPVACHHDNFDMYDSFHPWNSVRIGPKRDTLKEWKQAATKHGLKFGVSTHLYWSPRFLANARKYQKPGTPEWEFFNMDYSPMGYATQDSWNEHWYARCWDLIEKYDPDMFNNDSPYPRIGGGKGLGIKLFTDYVNRDLKENDGKQTVVLSFKDAEKDRAAFTYNLERGSAAEIKPEPWMWATDLSGNWFYRKDAINRMSIPVMVGNAVDAISKNGVVMLNVALRGDGTLPEHQAAYLTAFGDFLKINGEGIYGTRPWKIFGEGPLKMKDGRQGENHQAFSPEDIRFTTKDGVLFAFVLAPPTQDIVIKTLATGGVYDGDIGAITLLGSDETLTWSRTADALTIQRPNTLPGQIVNGFRVHSK